MSDVQPVQVPQGGEYGRRAELEAAQQAQPVAGRPSPPGRLAGALAPRAAPGPGQVPSLVDPSGRPTEAVQAGLPTGPGAGPEALSLASPGDVDLAVLKAIYVRYPSEYLGDIIDWAEANSQRQPGAERHLSGHAWAGDAVGAGMPEDMLDEELPPELAGIDIDEAGVPRIGAEEAGMEPPLDPATLAEAPPGGPQAIPSESTTPEG